MTQTVPAERRSPLRAFDFGLSLHAGSSHPRAAGASGGVGGKYIAGVRTVQGLNWSLGTHELWEGGNNFHRHANPDKVTWEALILEQGVALDDTLVDWADAARSYAMTGTVDPSAPVKRHLYIDLFKPRVKGQVPREVLQRFVVLNAWVKKLVILPKLDAMASEVSLSTVEIVHEGWYASPITP